MKIDITARHFTLSNNLKELIHEKLEKIVKFDNQMMSCHVILTKHSHNEEVEIIIHSRKSDFIAQENSHNFEKSFSNALDKIRKQVKRHHDRVTGH